MAAMTWASAILQSRSALLRRTALRRPLMQLTQVLLVVACTCFWLAVSVSAADPEHCAICGKRLQETVYKITDKSTHEKLFVCYACAICPDERYICGLPVPSSPLKLSDGRFLCARDAKTAIMDEKKAQEMCEEIREKLDRQFSRFLTLPSTNVTVALVDRVNLYDEFSVTGGNFECPDILGYIHSDTNTPGMTHKISIMSAMPKAQFQATCAHEYGHAWVFENVLSARRKTLDRDAHEGFCELLAWLLMRSLHEEDQQAKMLRNSYTRGQIDLFIAAEKTYGLNDILEWMRWGVNGRLKAADLSDVRNVEIPRAKSIEATNVLVYGVKPIAAPTTLVLKGISLAQNRPLALINDQSLSPGESARVRVGTSNVLVRCLTIGARSARFQLVDSGQELELRLPPAK